MPRPRPTREHPNAADSGPSAPAAQVADAFTALYGKAPEGLWAAPGRVNLIGEYTDFNDGFVMPLALPHTTVAAVSRRSDGILRLHSADTGGDVVELRVDDLTPAAERPPGATSSAEAGYGWAAYPAGVLWALRQAGHRVGGADVHLASSVPSGAGLSSSAALEVATALAFDDLYRLGLPSTEIARLCQRAENAFVGVPCGVMDQIASTCCTEGHLLHLDTRDLTYRRLPFDLAAYGLRLLVVDTRVKHALGDGAYAERRAGCERAARLLGVRALRDLTPDRLDDALQQLDDEAVRAYVRHVVSENQRVERVVTHLAERDVRAVGPVLTAGHVSLRDDMRVSCPELDLVVTAAHDAGALGARMTGGGFGGSAIVLAQDRDVPAVTEAVRQAFTAAGHRS
ncbi:galactokinase, partial [Streptomyces sparsus]